MGIDIEIVSSSPHSYERRSISAVDQCMNSFVRLKSLFFLAVHTLLAPLAPIPPPSPLPYPPLPPPFGSESNPISAGFPLKSRHIIDSCSDHDYWKPNESLPDLQVLAEPA